MESKHGNKQHQDHDHEHHHHDHDHHHHHQDQDHDHDHDHDPKPGRKKDFETHRRSHSEPNFMQRRVSRKPVGEGKERKRSRLIASRPRTSVGTGTTGSTGDGSSLPDDTDIFHKLSHKEHLQFYLNLGAFFFALILSLAVGFAMPKCFWTPRNVMYLEFPGAIFRNILSCLRFPLTSSSIIAAIGSMDLKTWNFITMRCTLYLFCSMIVASTFGTLMILPLGTQAVQLDPSCPRDICGETCPFLFSDASVDDNTRCYVPWDFLLDAFRRMFHASIINSFGEAESTGPDLSWPDDQQNGTRYSSCLEYRNDNTSTRRPLSSFAVEHVWEQNENIAGIIFLSVFIGICSLMAGEASRSFVNVFISFSEIFLQMASWALWLAPIAIISTVTGNFMDNSNPFDNARPIMYFLTLEVLSQLLFSFFIMPLYYYVVCRRSPFRFYRHIASVYITAFGIKSGFGVLPLTIKGLEENAHLDARVVRLVAPSFSILSAHGTAILVSSSVTFLYLRHKGFPDFGVILTIIVLSTVFTNSTYLTRDFRSLAIIPDLISILGIRAVLANQIITFTWIVDGFATATNAISGCVGMAGVHHQSRSRLKSLQREEERALKEFELAHLNKQWDTIQVEQK